MAKKMRVVQVPKAKGAFEIVERDIPEPGEGQVRVKVQACGVCHSDVVTKEGSFPGIQYPRVPGHEVAGVIDTLGAGVEEWKAGDRVGIGWHGGHCGHCDSCRRGDFMTCSNFQIPGISYDGGYEEYMVAPAVALAAIPAGLSPVEVGPLMCAGVTTFNSLRNSGARPGDLVAVLGIGGLGHLAVQYAAKSGYRTVAIARGKDKADFAKKLGAEAYIDNDSQDVAAELQKLGGAKIVLATATNAKAMSDTIGGLGPNGKLVVLGAPADELNVPVFPLLLGRRSVAGWPSGTSIDSQDTMAFSARMGVRSMNEVYPLEKAPEAFERMISGNARFRVVLKVAD
jgi:D-arabinose 1-dehydrogenase-like Zn-dependent alcohol dehydrogenase